MPADFFRINLPYGIAKNDNNEWVAFNIYYLPIGFNDHSMHIDLNKKSEYPVHTKYIGITESILLKLAHNEKGISRDQSGNVKQVWFYDERSNPMNNPDKWDSYIERIKIVSQFEAKK